MCELRQLYAQVNFTPDRLVVSLEDVLSKKVTLVTGQNCVRGTLLGKITIGAATIAAKTGGNTGTGTCVIDATTPILAGAQVGVYTLRCTAASTNAATFRLTDPAGRVLGDYSLSGAGASVTVANQIKCAITDASTDFVVGDGFDVTVAAGSGKYAKAVATAVDGSAIPDTILVEDTNATSADAEALAYYAGTFNPSAITYGSGVTAATAFETLRQKGIYLVSTPQPAAF